jgi:lipopolysaccharide biosynthesis protein
MSQQQQALDVAVRGNPPSATAIARPVCLLAQFDATGRIWPHVLHYVAALRDAGYRVVMACSGPPPSEQDVAAARGAGVSELVCRANGGLDFGAWRDLLREGHADGATGVLLANDSVYGPLWSLRETIESFLARSRARPDVWGMVETLQGGWHLQSWFVHLSAPVLASPAIRRVLDQPFERMSKPEIVERGEIGLGATLIAEGALCGALHQRGRWSWPARVVPLNPMHLDWRTMIAERTVPFLKVELLRDNPMAIPWIGDWPEVVAGQSDFPQQWVHSHLYHLVGRTRPYPGGPFLTPIPPISWRNRAILAAFTRDHGAAVRAIVRQALGKAWPRANADQPGRR